MQQYYMFRQNKKKSRCYRRAHHVHYILCLDKENSKLLSEIKSYRIARVTGSIYFSNNIVLHLQILLCFV